jgi:hypothetical protein
MNTQETYLSSLMKIQNKKYGKQSQIIF